MIIVQKNDKTRTHRTDCDSCGEPVELHINVENDHANASQSLCLCETCSRALAGLVDMHFNRERVANLKEIDIDKVSK